MEATDSFEVRTFDEVGIRLPDESEGTVFLLGDRDSLADTAHVIDTVISWQMESKQSFYDYRVSIIDVPSSVLEALDFNIVCCIPNPLSEEKEYLAAHAEQDELQLAVIAIIREAETTLKSYFKEAVIANALLDPMAFRNTIDEIIPGSSPEDGIRNSCSRTIYPPDGCRQKTESQAITASPGEGVGSPAPVPSHINKYERSSSEDDDDRCATQTRRTIAWENSRSETHSLEYLSAGERKAMFFRIPDKVGAAVARQSPEVVRFVDEVTDNFTPEESRAILKIFLKRFPKAAREMVYTALGGASNYELLIKPRGVTPVRPYKDKVQYLMYLRDLRGHEIPVVFTHAPSFCIYIMHVIDRFNNRDNTRALDLRNLEKEFCRVYATLFDESEEKITRIYHELENRLCGTPGDRRTRRGRYPEYIKDIHRTFERLLGMENSMPFKIGSTRFLPLHPSKIIIPPDLTRIRIS